MQSLSESFSILSLINPNIPPQLGHLLPAQYRRISMQLDVFPGSPQELEESIDDFVFTDALVAHEQQMFAQTEVAQHRLQHASVLSILVKHEIVRDQEGFVGSRRSDGDGGGS